MRRFLSFILFLVVISTGIKAQTVANIQVGSLLVSNDNDKFSYRPGYNVAIHARIGSPGFFMCPGLTYQRFTISEYDKTKYVNNLPSYSIVKISTNAGFENKIVKWLKYRFFAGLNLNYLSSIDNNSKNINFNSVYEGFVGWDYGVGISIGFITLDYKYEKSFTEFYKDIDKTKINFRTIVVGIAF
ncbi:MAG TPA: hypothetical protein ENK91_06375 [Bacteroidetes bacterium]|jgi:hypothetical protein|nr:hypothetical protein [Bacteroidota bacterium]